MRAGKKIVLSVLALLSVLSMGLGGYLLGRSGTFTYRIPASDGPVSIFVAGKAGGYVPALFIAAGVVLLAGVCLTLWRPRR